MSSPTHFVKARRWGEKTFRFIGDGGSLVRKRVYALRFEEKDAREKVAEIRNDPLCAEWEVKIQRMPLAKATN